ncbi:MAG: tetratricopeptide repeat protein [Terriglobia bacterium]
MKTHPYFSRLCHSPIRRRAVALGAILALSGCANPRRGFESARSQNTAAAYHQFAEKYPSDPLAVEARQRWQQLAFAARGDDGVYEAALQQGTPGALKEFLSDYPGHSKAAEAQHALQTMTTGEDVVDLLREKKIEVATEGDGIQSVSVRVRRLVPYTVTVLIPVGTFFDAGNSSEQSMVATEESGLTLSDSDWHEITAAAACANRPKDVPQSGDAFSVERAPAQVDLAKLMPVLDRANVEYAVRQAAVWIVTDNADYDDLGELIASSNGGVSGERVIDEADAARAMQICEQAGISIREKAIWGDRERIANGVDDEQLKKWLTQKR